MAKPTRRKFLITTGTVSAASLLTDFSPLAQAQSLPAANREPWYAQCYRWGQTNLSMKDMATIDVGWWREYWKATRIQAVLLFGPASYTPFPSRNPLLESSPFAPNRDVFGELNTAARADGIHVLTRVDLGIVTERVGKAFARLSNGRRQRSAWRHVPQQSLSRETRLRNIPRDYGPLPGGRFHRQQWSRGQLVLLRILQGEVAERRWRRTAAHDQHGGPRVLPLAAVERKRRLGCVGRNAGVRETDRWSRLRGHELHPQERHEQSGYRCACALHDDGLPIAQRRLQLLRACGRSPVHQKSHQLGKERDGGHGDLSP